MVQELKTFETTVYGKWILAGEHTVLRGGPAIVFPVYHKSLKLKFKSTDSHLRASFQGDFGEDLSLLFWGVLRRALDAVGQTEREFLGDVELINNIPVGAGMGASAALSVAVARLCVAQNWIRENEVFEFSRQLENIFHGESSGVDIAVALAGSGIKYLRVGGCWPIFPQWQPKWYLSYSGKKGITSECVGQVKRLAKENAVRAQELDEQMKKSAELAESALAGPGSTADLLKLKESLDMALVSFQGWGLTKGLIGEHMEQLRDLGALAVKPTGSGDGGFVLSLWKSEPPKNSAIEFIPL